MKKTPLTLAAIWQRHQAGRLDEAEQDYLALLEQGVDQVKVLDLLGLLYAEQGQLDKAQNCFEQAINLDQDEPILRLHCANILKAKGFLDQAKQMLIHVINVHPTLAAAFNNLGTIYFAEGNWQEAIVHYQKAIDLQSNYIDAYYNLGLALTKAKREQEALSVYQSILELAPQHVGAQFQLGSLFMQKNQYQNAIDYFSLVEEKHPFHFETQTNLGTIYLKLGQFKLAEKHYLKALELMPNDTQVLFNLGVMYVQEGRFKEAIEFYLRAIHIAPDFYAAHYNAGVIFLMMKNTQQALFHFHKALQIQPHNETVQHLIHIHSQNKKLSASPPEYIRSLFDAYADHYDAHLTQSLHYEVPQHMYQIVKETNDLAQVKWRILDLGCGTGLCGALFKPIAQSLVGVDISENMLAVAAQKAIYNELITADLLTFLNDSKAVFDLILAGDTLVYFGDLTAIFAAIRERLSAHGLFVFNAEISKEDDYKMTAAGRFAHHKHYLDQLAKQNQFTLLAYRVVPLRTQNQEVVFGHLYLLQVDVIDLNSERTSGSQRGLS